MSNLSDGDECPICGGVLHKKLVSEERKCGDLIIVLNNLTLLVCDNCTEGEFYDEDSSARLDIIAAIKKKIIKFPTREKNK